MKQFVVSGIGTDVGKTVVSATVSEALSATYWKPIQAGDLSNSDSIKIKSLTANVKVLKEVFQLSQPMSPHAAAEIDSVNIQLKDFKIPQVDSNLIIEGAGGILVPINNEGLTYADVFEFWNLPVLLVSKHYLGSINHSLMTAEVLKNRGVKVAGWIFVGEENKATESIIISITQVPFIARIPIVDEVSIDFIVEQALKLKEVL